MSIYHELSPDRDIAGIDGIRFCIMSPDEILRMSCAEISKTDTYVSNEPVLNGLFDPRMGVTDHNRLCPTCDHANNFCPGHFGHIVLAKPVFYIQFFDVVKKILKCVCYKCSKLLISPEHPQLQAILKKKLITRQKRWELVSKLISSKKCEPALGGCGARQPDKVFREPVVKLAMEWKKGGNTSSSSDGEPRKLVLLAEDVLEILRKISDEHAEILGFSAKYNRPEWMICTVLPVPPPAVRPSVRTETGQRSEDDLTHKLCDIVKANNSLRTKLDKQTTSKEQVEVATQVLQYHVATFIDNKIPGVNPAAQRTGRLLKSLTERLKSKDGRIRGNLMGKRVTFSARSVITPDPNISIDELGVPMVIAMNLTFPEVVNHYNRDRLLRYVSNGPDKYPGAKFVRSGEWTKSLKSMPNRAEYELKIGDVVHRHLIDGDYVLFNRQPSLHKYSMLCHRVKVVPHNTFRLNVVCCPAYNSDYDGDEMNLFSPQSLITAIELAELASVPRQIISARECKPILSIVQDIALGVYRLTKPHTTLTEKQVCNLLALNPCLQPVPAPVGITADNMNIWSGRQLLSSIVPDTINIRAPNKSFSQTARPDEDDRDNYVIIKRGQLIQGTLDKGIYQNRTRGLVHSIFNECGPEAARAFFDNTQRLICDWLVQSGFSVGVSDLIVPQETIADMKRTIHEMKVKVYDVIRDIHDGKFENRSVNDTNVFFEREVNKILNETISKVGKIALLNLDDRDNRMVNMVKSGSKGSIINISQMIACLGQQNVDGKRISYGFDDRTLPHFLKYDDGPESRGFIENSFMSGLTPQEFFFHSMGGREGLIDTAVKTAQVGYIQRKLVKAMEDCKVSYDRSVRDASGHIIQFLYGEDGMDGTKIEAQPIPYVHSSEHLERDYLYDAPGLSAEVRGRCRRHYERILEDREFLLKEIFAREGPPLTGSLMYPVSFAHLITDAAAAAATTTSTTSKTPLTAEHVLDEIERLSARLTVRQGTVGDRFIQILLRCFLNPKSMIAKHAFTKEAFDGLVAKIQSRFLDAMVNPSEMVGVMAAQSIGEPCTQLTLNTFHNSGQSSSSKIVRGVPRIQELLSVTKNVKAPSMSVFVREELCQDKQRCKQIINTIETRHFWDIVSASQIVYEPRPFESTISADDDALLRSYRELIIDAMGLASGAEYDCGPWVLRIELSREKMLEYEVSMMDAMAANSIQVSAVFLVYVERQLAGRLALHDGFLRTDERRCE